MMDKKININKHLLCLNKKNIKICMMSDLHLSNSFDNSKLDIIKESIENIKPDYLFIAGDIVDSTNFLYKNIELKNYYNKFFESISKKYKTIIVRGNHDLCFKVNKRRKEDKENDFFKSLAKINNITISNDNDIYEDDNILVNIIEMPLKYYKKSNPKEFKEKIKKYKIKNDKINILLTHSPINLDSKLLENELSKYDLILAGHTHGGAIPFNLGKHIKGNRGFISPSKKFFPKNVRGLLKFNNTYLIISGGITKIQECSKISFLNHLFIMEIDNIEIKGE